MSPGSRTRPTQAALFATTVLFLAACGDDPVGDGPFRRFWNLHRTGRVEIRAPSGPLAAVAGELADAAAERAGLRASVVRSSDAAQEGGSGAMRIVLGTFEDPLAVELARGLGVTPLSPGGFRFAGRDFTGPGDTVVAAFPDPDRPGLPALLVVGGDAAEAAYRCRRLPDPWREELVVWSEGVPILARSPGGEAPGERDLSQEVAAFLRRSPTSSLHGLTVRYEAESVPAERAESYAARTAAALERARAWLGIGEGDGREPIELRLVPHAEVMRRLFGRAEPSRIALAPRVVHALLAPGVPDDGGAGCVRLVASERGAPAEAWLLDGLASAATGTWLGRSLEEWGARLAAAGLVPPAADLVAPGAGRRIGPHVRAPLLGLLFRRLAVERDPGTLWTEGVGPDVDLQRALRAALAELGPAPPSERTASDEAASAEGRWLGVAFHGVGGAYDGLGAGYASRALASELADTAEAGATAFSLEAFAAPGSGPGALFDLGPPAVRSAVSDVELLSALAAGRAVGLRSVLRVHPLDSPGGPLADGIALVDAEDFGVGAFEDPGHDAFFQRYEHVLFHYALLAELAGVDLLCIGAGLENASATDAAEIAPPELAYQRLDRWRRLIADVRRCFGGELTYAASLRGESEYVGFWSDLDYASVAFGSGNSGNTEPPADWSARAYFAYEFEAVDELARRSGRPVLLLPAGAAQRRELWREPFVPHGPVDPEERRRYFLTFAESLQEGDAPRGLAGLFLWCGDPDPVLTGDDPGDFVLSGAAGREIQEALFAR